MGSGLVKRYNEALVEISNAEARAAFFRATVRAVNWQRVFAEIGYAATLRCVEKYANQLYQEIESAHVAHPTPAQLRDVTDSGLVVF